MPSPTTAAVAAPARPAARLRDSAARLLPLAWPVFVGQLSVLAFGTVDTVLLARYDSADLAAFAVGVAAYITIFIGFMGVVLALGPIVGRLYGAGQHAEAGRQTHQTVWLVLALAGIGSALLIFPYPFLWLSGVGPDVAPKVRGYLLALALSLPASLMFTVYRGFNTAVSRPKAVMALQMGGLVLKVPLSYLLVFGAPSLGLPALGVVGCGIGTCIVMWAQLLIAWNVLRRDPFYAPFQLFGRGLDKPQRATIRAQLKLGLPMGATILVEVTGFAFMALFLARLGTITVAGHQIAVNLVSMLFMMPLAVANATSTLVAQRIGAHDEADAVRLGWHGLLLGCLLATVLGGVVSALREPIVNLYTRDAAVIAAALPMMAFVGLFHVADAAQTIAALVLRAWHVATAPFVIYAIAIWGLGLGGGYLVGFEVLGPMPPALQGARGFWLASTASLVLTALALIGLLVWVLKQRGGLVKG
jgi:multidrug resistance protein, MATE family